MKKLILLDRLKEKNGVYSVPFFLIAVITLLSAKPGPLTYPGVAAGVSGVVFALTGMGTLSAAAGLLSAATSFTAQFLYGICVSCTYAAALFAVAGIISTYQVMVKRENTAQMIFLALPLLAGMSMYVYQAYQINNQQVHTQSVKSAAIPDRYEQQASVVGLTSGAWADKNSISKLYFAPWCHSCEESLREFIKNDPEGTTWQPVVVSYSEVSEGEKLVRRLGYKGKLIAEVKSPGRGVPCLKLPDGRILVGKSKIIKMALTLEKEANT